MSLVFWQHFGTGDVRVMLHVAGLASIKGNALHLEWQVNKVEHIRGAIEKGEIVRRVIPFSLIESISYTPKWFGAGSLTIRARDLGALEGLPGVIGPFWSVRIARSEKPRARALVADVALGLANHRLLELESGDDA